MTGSRRLRPLIWRRHQKWLYLCIALLLPGLAKALTFALPPKGNNVVGQIQVIKVKAWNTFHTIARRYDMGYQDMVDANPKVDPKWPLPGSKVIVPSEFVLPPGSRKGIVINLAEMRLYYYLPKKHEVMTFPIGIGMVGWETPTGKLHIIQRIKNPTWVVPKSIIKAAKKNGYDLPKKILPGPKDPLGKFALRLSDPSYLIHGTNEPPTIGMRSSSGCIRLYPEDIAQLFAVVPTGASVRIINQPYKVGWRNGKLYLQVYPSLSTKMTSGEVKQSDTPNLTPMIKAINQAIKGQPISVNWQAATRIALHPNGIAQVIASKSGAV